MEYFLALIIILVSAAIGYISPLFPLILITLLFSVVVMTFLLPKGKRKFFSSYKKHHCFTIIIPSYKEGGILKKTLDSILASDYPQSKIDMIVVYRPSKKDMKTKKIARWARDNHTNVVFYKKMGSKAKAINFAVNKTRSKWIGLFDADSVIKKDFFKIASEYASLCDKRRISCFIGSYRVENKNKNIITVLQSVDMFQIREPLTKLGNLLEEANFHGYNGFFKRELLKQFPLEEQHPTEDVNLSSRLMAAGISRLPASELLTNYSAVFTFEELWYQRKRWARGNWKVLFEKNGVKEIFKNSRIKTIVFESVYQIYSNLSVLLLLVVVSSIGAIMLHQRFLILPAIVAATLYLSVVLYILQNAREHTLSFADVYSILFPLFFTLGLGFIYLVGFSEEILKKRFVWVKLRPS